MKTRNLAGPTLSLLGMGCMRLPQTAEKAIDEAVATAMVDEALARGVNYFDTAYFYHDGKSESFLGRALVARHDRDSFYLATKMPVSLLEVPEDAPRIFDEQLARLQTDHFDFYLCHALSAANFEKMEKLGLYDFLQKKKAEGAIRHLGFSFHDSPEVLETICSAHDWEFAQLQLNYLDWEMQRSREQYEVLRRHGLPCIVMEPVRGGALADLGEEANGILAAARPDWSPAAWALRFAASLEGVMVVLSGMSSPAQLADNLRTFEAFAPLSGEERAVLDQALEAFRRRTFLPCTSCRYCADCPQAIDIPTVFARYNQYALHHSADFLHKQLQELPEGHRPADCISCGLCASRCPQHIAIPEKMAEIAAL